MRRLFLTTCAVAVALVSARSGTATAATLCVGGPGCFSTIQAAVSAAHDGDTIAIAPGTYAGGITIDVDITLLGAGANKTTIEGGGPVLTIGTAQQFPPAEPTVAVRGVTITGGGTTSGFLGDWDAVGGGVEIPPSCTIQPACPSFEYGPGATVTIANTVITGNKVIPTGAIPLCGGPCAFASGGGIDNAGALTVTNTAVSNNQSGSMGSPTLGAFAGGIANVRLGTLTLSRSRVTGNRVVVSAPNGQFAQAGGIQNSGAAKIDHTVVSGNGVDATGVGSEVLAFAGGIDDDGSLTLTNSSVDHNHVAASAPTAVGALVLTDAGGIEIDGTATISDSSITHNSATSQAPDGQVVATGGGLLAASADGATIQRSLIAHNSISADSTNGSVFVQGGGVTNFGLLTLDQTRVVANRGASRSTGAVIQGGGIWNSNFQGGPPTTPQLTLTNSEITANTLSASPPATPQGAGLYTTYPVALTRTAIAGNRPDQCFGC